MVHPENTAAMPWPKAGTDPGLPMGPLEVKQDLPVTPTGAEPPTESKRPPLLSLILFTLSLRLQPLTRSLSLCAWAEC